MTTARARRYLFTMWEGGGTVPPELGLAKRLLARGHHVHVLGDPTLERPASAIGCGFTPWREAPHRASLDPADDLLKDWEANSPMVMLKRARDRFLAGPAALYARETRAAVEATAADAVVADVMLLGSIAGGQAAGVPVAAVVPNIWMLPTPGVPPVGPGLPLARHPMAHARDALMRFAIGRLFDSGLPAINRARSEHGLPRLRSFWDQVRSADRILVLTSAHFDFAADRVPEHVRYVGPILDEPDWAGDWNPPWDPSSDDPKVLVAFSSTYQNQAATLQRVIDALAELPVRAVATLGQALDADAVMSAPNVAVVRSAPHIEILATASVAITHCGHGTTMKALAAGVPMVCMPMGRDQNDTAARVVHHGAGIRLTPRADAAAVRRAVRNLLEEPSYRRNAQRLAASIRAEIAAADPAGELEHLVPAPAAPPAGAAYPHPAAM